MSVTNFHESYVGANAKPPSDRSTGLVFAVIAVFVAGRWHQSAIAPWLLLAALILGLVSLTTPAWLRPLTIGWFSFGLLLHRMMTPVVMILIFGFIIVPSGLIMKLWRDPLVSRRPANASTYWIERSVGEANEGSMTNQY
jgi:hypothetical protein